MIENNYEWKAFRKSFWGIAVFILPVLFVLLTVGFGIGRGKALGIALVFLLFEIMVYGMVRNSWRKIYRDVNYLSKEMMVIIDRKGELSPEVYKEGDIGYLYTCFYKMVSILQNTKEDVMQEKIFLQDVISDISHQLKTPMSSIKVFLDLLYEDKIPEEEKRKQVIGEAQNQLNRMEWMVLSMLKLSRIEAGAVVFEKKTTDVESVVKEAVDAISYLTGERGQLVRIQREASGEKEDFKADGGFYCDKEWLVEAIINLLKNASDYSERDTEIVVKTEENNIYTRIYVQDHGKGIPEETLPFIFKRFYRADPRVNPNSVGIGLSLTESIIRGMGGQVSVKSRVGEGTCFTLTFLK